jgi:hypothetical protein
LRTISSSIISFWRAISARVNANRVWRFVYSRTKPDLAFDYFRRLIVLDEHRFLIDKESGREIVRNALASTGSREAARAFVNSLGSEGQFQFADLLE